MAEIKKEHNDTDHCDDQYVHNPNDPNPVSEQQDEQQQQPQQNPPDVSPGT